MFPRGSFFDKYFDINLSDYPAFGFDFNISLLLFGIFAGICAAIVVVTMRKCASTAALRQLLRHEAIGEGEAKSLSEIGLAENKSASRAFSRDKMLRRYVKLVGEAQISYEEYMAMSKAERQSYDKGREIDPMESRFFIPEESADRALLAVQSDTSSPFTAALLCLVMLAAFVGFSMAMPSILSFLETLVG